MTNWQYQQDRELNLCLS